MKYWNKDKRIRQKHWHAVKRNVIPQVGVDTYQTIKQRLQRMDSPGKFYLYYGSNTVWFEREQDAAWFALSQA